MLFKSILREFSPGKLLIARLQEFALVGIALALGWLGRADPFLIFAVAAVVGFGGVFALEKTKNKRLGQAVAILIILLGGGLVGWTVWDKSAAAERYELTFETGMMERSVLVLDKDKQPVVPWETWVIKVYNPNNFKVYVSIKRRYGSIRGVDTETVASPLNVDDDEAREIDELPPHHAITCGTEVMRLPVRLGRTYTGDFSCIIKYGKDRAHLDKTFDFTRKIQAIICPDVNVVCDYGYY